MDLFTAWPFLGLMMALGLSVSTFQHLYLPKSRALPPTFFTSIALPLYMVHQFEEHGYDLFLRPFQFRNYFCESMNAPLETCAMTAKMIFFINTVAVWGIGFGSYLDKTGSGAGANFLGLELVNALLHFGGYFSTGTVYNPGFLTSAIFFVPVAYLGFHSLLCNRVLSWKGVARALGVAFICHAILMLSVMSVANGLISENMACLIQALNCLPGLWIIYPI